jgi:small subunit ribosomal protein S4
MARYLGSKTKLSKKIGRNLFLKGARSYSAKDDYTKRPVRPGMHGKKFKAQKSNYGKQLLEKQALRFTYGLVEKQLSLVFKKASRSKGDTGKTALAMLERRLDNVIYKAGLASSRSQARQLVSHGHFQVNGVNTNIPSFLVSTGDHITIKPNKTKKAFWQNFQIDVPVSVPAWLEASAKDVKVLNEPTEADLPQDFDIASIVEWYSTRVA